MQTLRPICLFGGTFDPVHNGHIYMAKYLMTLLHWQQIQLIPNKYPDYRSTPIATPRQRATMLRLATAFYSGMTVNSIEIKRPDVITRTIDTVRAIRQHLPDQQALCFVLGSDAYSHLHTWHCWQELIELVHLIVIERPTAIQQKRLPLWLEKHLQSRGVGDPSWLTLCRGGMILKRHINAPNISATDVRRKLNIMFEHAATDMDILRQDYGRKIAIPKPVLHYIIRHRLYSVNHKRFTHEGNTEK